MEKWISKKFGLNYMGMIEIDNKRNNSLINVLYIMMLILWILPSGSIFGFPIKLLIILSTFIGIIADISKRSIVNLNSFIGRILMIAFFIFLWTCLGLWNGYDNGVKPLIVSFASLLLTVLVSFLYIEYYLNRDMVEKIYRVLSLSVFVFIGSKVLIEILLMFNVLSYSECSNIFRNTLNSSIMMLPVKIGNTVGSRLSTPNDTIPLVFLSFDLIFSNSKKRTVLLVVLSIIYIFIVFSRIVFLQYALIIIVAIHVRFKKASTNKRISYIISSIIILAIAFVYLDSQKAFLDEIHNLFELRFSGNQVEYSDSIRSEEAYYLWKGFDKHFLIGNGLGSYSKECIRSMTNPASYELEYLSFLFQFGIIGFIVIIGSLIVLFYQKTVNANKDKTVRWILLMNFIIWGVKPFFNPQFLSSSSGMVISVLAIMAFYYNTDDISKI